MQATRYQSGPRNNQFAAELIIIAYDRLPHGDTRRSLGPDTTADSAGPMGSALNVGVT